MAATGPNPGRTPTRVPVRTPMKQKKRFMGVRATWKPSKALFKNSIGQIPQGPFGNWACSQTSKMR